MMVKETAEAANSHPLVSESSACAMAQAAAVPPFQSQTMSVPIPCVSNTHYEEMDVVRQRRRRMGPGIVLEDDIYKTLVCPARLIRSWSP